jgi:sec-independent protein translocase protein TatB
LIVGSVGFSEITVIVILALFILGPDRLPQAARSIGKALAEFRRLTDGARRDLEEAIDTTELRSTLNEIKGTVDSMNPRRVVADSLRSVDLGGGSVQEASDTNGSSSSSAAALPAASLIPPPDADVAEADSGQNGFVVTDAPVARAAAPSIPTGFHDVLLDDEPGTN